MKSKSLCTRPSPWWTRVFTLRLQLRSARLVDMQQPARVSAVYFCQISLAQTRFFDDSDGMFDILLSFLAKAERIIGAEDNLLAAKHSGNAGDYSFIGRSRRIVKQLAKVMTGFVLAFALAKSSLDPTC